VQRVNLIMLNVSVVSLVRKALMECPLPLMQPCKSIALIVFIKNSLHVVFPVIAQFYQLTAKKKLFESLYSIEVIILIVIDVK
jgi:hypothetical protein